MARAAEKLLSPDFRPRPNSDLVACAADKNISSDFRPRGNSDLVAGLKGVQI